MRMPRPPILMLTIAASLAVLAGGAFGVASRLLWSSARIDAYRQRLDELHERYDALSKRYDQAVRRTAVTELIVQGGQLRVRVRDVRGTVREIPTSLDPQREIYVDYVVLDGRLWIRRLFDADTPPSRGLVIDPGVDGVTWDIQAARVGKAVYRSLGEGRWVVSVTGNGSLGLTRAGDAVDLDAAPRVREFAPRDDEDVGEVGFADVLRQLGGGVD